MSDDFLHGRREFISPRVQFNQILGGSDRSQSRDEFIFHEFAHLFRLNVSIAQRTGGLQNVIDGGLHLM